MLRCALCQDALCTKACGKPDPAGLLRSVWFDDEKTAAARLPVHNPCAAYSAPCETACVRPRQVPVRDLITRLHEEVRPQLEIPLPEDETRLRTELCGVALENPFLLSSSVVASTFDMCERAFEAGWQASPSRPSVPSTSTRPRPASPPSLERTAASSASRTSSSSPTTAWRRTWRPSAA